MGLKVLIPVRKEFDIGDIWCDEKTFHELSSTELRELFKEDILGFIDSLGGFDVLLDSMEFYWRDK